MKLLIITLALCLATASAFTGPAIFSSKRGLNTATSSKFATTTFLKASKSALATNKPRKISGPIGKRIKINLGNTGAQYTLILNYDNGDEHWKKYHMNTDYVSDPDVRSLHELFHESFYNVSCGAYAELIQYISDFDDQGKQINFFRYFHDDQYFISHEEGYNWKFQDENLLKELNDGKENICDIVVATDGSWVVLYDSYFEASNGIDDILTSILTEFYKTQKKFQEDQNQRIKQHNRRQKQETKRKSLERERKKKDADSKRVIEAQSKADSIKSMQKQIKSLNGQIKMMENQMKTSQRDIKSLKKMISQLQQVKKKSS